MPGFEDIQSTGLLNRIIDADATGEGLGEEAIIQARVVAREVEGCITPQIAWLERNNPEQAREIVVTGLQLVLMGYAESAERVTSPAATE